MSSQKAKQGYRLVQTLFGKDERIPEEWELIDLNKHTIIKDGNWILEENYSNDGVRLLQVGDIGIGSFLDKSKKFISEKTCKDLKCMIIEQGKDVLISRMPDPIGRSCISPILPYQYIVAVDISILKPDTKKFDTHYLIHTLNNSTNLNNVRKYVAGTTRQRISRKNLESLPILFPPLPEQKKIASILSSVDELINKCDETINKTNKLKTGLMQILLTKGIGHKKFKKVKWLFGKKIEIPEEWEMTTVGKEFVLSAGGTPKTSNPEFYKGNIHWVTSTDLNRSVIQMSTAHITKDAVKKTNLKTFPKGSFIIAAIGVDAAQTRGNCGILGFDATINQVCVGFEKSKRVRTEFFFYYYLQYGNNWIFAFYQGTKQWAFYPYIIRKIHFPLPSIQEQEKIVLILASIDSKISELESRKTNLKKLKKGLMQKLLTGQILVKV